MPSNVLPLDLKQTFPPTIWIFTEGEGDGIEIRLPFKIFSTLPQMVQNPTSCQYPLINYLGLKITEFTINKSKNHLDKNQC